MCQECPRPESQETWVQILTLSLIMAYQELCYEFCLTSLAASTMVRPDDII
jgi:hypothetical protein